MFVGLFAAAAGFAPTGLSTSVLIGSWSMAKGEGAGELRDRGLDPEDEAHHDYIRAWIQTGRRDFNIGYAFSFVLIVAMVVLAANVLYPNPPADANLAVAIGTILSDSSASGPTTRWSSARSPRCTRLSSRLDGASRATGDIVLMAVERPDLDGERIRKAVVVAIVAVSIGVVLTLGAVPVTFLIWISAILAITEILFYPANWYVVREHLPEQFQPSRRWVAYYAISLAVVLVRAHGCGPRVRLRLTVAGLPKV